MSSPPVSVSAQSLSPNDTPSIVRLKSLLRRTLRVTVNDGRIFLGTFAGTDKQLNILLVNTDEFRLSPAESANLDGRYVGLVMIPWRLVVTVEAHRHAAERGDSDDPYA